MQPNNFCVIICVFFFLCSFFTRPRHQCRTRPPHPYPPGGQCEEIYTLARWGGGWENRKQKNVSRQHTCSDGISLKAVLSYTFRWGFLSSEADTPGLIFRVHAPKDIKRDSAAEQRARARRTLPPPLRPLVSTAWLHLVVGRKMFRARRPRQKLRAELIFSREQYPGAKRRCMGREGGASFRWQLVAEQRRHFCSK